MMFFLLSLPISLTSLILYLFLTFLGNDLWVWWASLLVSILLLSSIFRNFFRNINLKNYFSLKNLLLVIIILFFVFAKAFVLSPFAFIKTTDSFKHFQITDVGDYYKHTFIATMLSKDGIPPDHPYFPVTKLSYYFGYYLIPASLSRVFNLAPNQVFYTFSLVADTLGLLIILRILNRSLQTYRGKLLGLFLLFSAAGVNVLPKILEKFPIPGYMISPESFWSGVGFQLLNNYTALLFVPQHFFAACLTVGLVYYLIWEKPKVLFSSSTRKQTCLFTSITASFIFLSSLFVSWVFILWLLLIFIFYPQKRVLLILTGAFSLLILVPYFLQLSSRPNLFSLNRFHPYQFIASESLIGFLINTLFTAIIQYGPIFAALPIAAIFLGRTFLKNHWRLILGLSMPFIITWFLRSRSFNDFSLRGLMPLQLILPIIFIKLLESSKQKLLKVALLSVSILTIGLGLVGFFLEYSGHWKKRMILHPNVSRLIFEIRKIPDSTKLAAIDRDRWVEFIPSLGFKKVLSPFLFDSFDYFAGKKTLDHGEYERLALELFIEPNVAPDLRTLVADKNRQLGKVYEFFNKFKADLLILNNQLWVKKDINPWLEAFVEMGVKLEPITGNYTLVDYPSLLRKTSQYQISIQEDKRKEIPVKEKSIFLEKGFWYLSGCSSKKENLFLELEDYYQLFNQDLDGEKKSCVGKIFYLQKDGTLSLTHHSTVKSVYAFPVDITIAR